MRPLGEIIQFKEQLQKKLDSSQQIDAEIKSKEGNLAELIFMGLTAWDTQKLLHIGGGLNSVEGDAVAHKLAIVGALALYLDFTKCSSCNHSAGVSARPARNAGT